MKKPLGGVPECIVSFNAEVGRGGVAMTRSIKQIIEAHPRVSVILLQESEGYVDDLRKNFKGWKTYAKKGWSESDNCPIMVKRTSYAPRMRYQQTWGTLKCDKGWIGPKAGKKHPGRTWTWVKVGGIYILSLHRVWGGEQDFKGNGAAYQEEARKLTGWIRNKDAPVIVFGDTNCGYHETHPHSMRDIRDNVRGKLIADEDKAGIDYALVKRLSAEVRRSGDVGSDHNPVVMSGIKVL
jgi:endonuclease/exonuclease/phosphatase family metal-dependent hydrolase